MESMYDLYSAWKLERLGKFTASNIGKLLVSSKTKGEVFGDGAITLINGVISEILTGESADDMDYGEIKSLEWGRAHEDEAVRELTQYLGVPVEYYGILNPQFFPFNKISGGSPDGKVPTVNAVIETKCPINKANHVAALRAFIEYKEAPANKWLQKYKKDYYAQVQFNMMCTATDFAYFVSYDPRTLKQTNKLAVLKIMPDPVMVAEIEMRIDLAKNIVRETLEGLDTLPTHLAEVNPKSIAA